jgi:hypothetical protein
MPSLAPASIGKFCTLFQSPCFQECKQKKSAGWLAGCRFHTYDYARHFVSACTRILGLEGTPEGVEDQGKLTRVAAVCPLVP